jgi:hypothetical protein
MREFGSPIGVDFDDTVDIDGLHFNGKLGHLGGKKALQCRGNVIKVTLWMISLFPFILLYSTYLQYSPQIQAAALSTSMLESLFLAVSKNTLSCNKLYYYHSFIH